MADHNISQLVKYYKTQEEILDKFLKHVIGKPCSTLKDRRPILMKSNGNINKYIRYLTRHYILLRRISSARNKYYALQILKEDKGHRFARLYYNYLVKITKELLKSVTSRLNQKQNGNCKRKKKLVFSENMKNMANIKVVANGLGDRLVLRGKIRNKRASPSRYLSLSNLFSKQCNITI